MTEGVHSRIKLIIYLHVHTHILKWGNRFPTIETKINFDYRENTHEII